MSYIKKLSFIGSFELSLIRDEYVTLGNVTKVFTNENVVAIDANIIAKSEYRYQELGPNFERMPKDLKSLFRDLESDFWYKWDKVEFTLFVEDDKIKAFLSLWEWYEGVTGFCYSPARYFKLWEVKLEGFSEKTIRPLWDNIDRKFHDACQKLYLDQKEAEFKKAVEAIKEKVLSNDIK